MKRLLLLCLLAGTALAQQSPEFSVKTIFAPGGITGPTPQDVRWSPDGNRVSYILRDNQGEHAQLWYVDVSSGRKTVLVAESKLSNLAPPLSRLREREQERRTRYSVAQYYWSPDSHHLLFDALGQLWLYSLETGTAVQITSSPEHSEDPSFSPDGSQIAFLRKHNLYLTKQDGSGLRQLTSEGEGDIRNGEVDWVYAEELDVRHNYFWSPDGKQILFLQMNENPVPTYPIADLIPTQPTVDNQRYPKPGDPNPQVRLGVVNASGGKVNWLKLPVAASEKDPGPARAHEFYIPRFGWVRPGLVWAQVLNRAQNRLDLYFADVKSGHVRIVLSEQSPTWIEVNDDFTIVPPGERFLWTSWRDGHTHLYLYSFNNADPLSQEARLETQLTRGDFEVFDVAGLDEDGRTVFFTANAGDDRQRQLFRVNLDGSGFQKVSREAGTHVPAFGPGAKWYVDNFSALMIPPRLSLCRADGACHAFWESASIAEYKLPTPEFLDFRANDGTLLRGELTLPLESPAGSKVPLVLYPYGGPGEQEVREVWGGSRFLFNELLARRGIAVLTVDNRGMAGRGRAFAAAAHGEFGKVQIEDQLAALHQALDRYPQLDKERVGIWGWSFGGTMTLWAMTRSTAFKAGASVAPVTDWHDYDSIYTERYLGLPQQNPDGYRRSSPVTTAAGLSGSLLLVHGTGDDNVHFQNTVQMTQAFITAGKLFQVMFYPRKLHSISGTQAETDLFTRIERLFAEELLGRDE